MQDIDFSTDCKWAWNILKLFETKKMHDMHDIRDMHDAGIGSAETR